MLSCSETSTRLSAELDAMSFNIRYGLADDGEDSWEYRRERVIDVISEHQPDVLGLQEALEFQLKVILDAFPEYDFVGIGRDPGGEGEYTAILYRSGRFENLDSGTFWLSETPDVPSTHWGNRHLRICTWVRLMDITSGQSFYVYNTHFDHQSQPSRENSSKLLADRIAGRPHKDPVILMGDFNAGEDNPAIAYLTGMQSALERAPVILIDTFREIFPDQTIVGTFNGFEGKVSGDKIDYIFVLPGTKVRDASIIKDARDGRYPSDHFPVFAKVILE